MDSFDPTAERLRLRLDKGVQQLGLQLIDEQSESLIQFLALLHKWNRVYNLTAVRSMEDMVGRHILDSLAVLKWLPTIDAVTSSASPITSVGTATPQRNDVLDVGTGAGLPVLPLAIVRPDLQFLSVESSGKKTRFQQQAVMELGLSNVRIEQARIEDVVDHANIIISRAFTAPDKFLKVVQKNCIAQSQVIIMLGSKERMPDDLPDGFTFLSLQEVDVPLVDSTRHVAVCQYDNNASHL